MKCTSNGDIPNIVNELRKLGWTIENNRHIKCTAPNGKIVVISNTPRCPFTFKKILRYIKYAHMESYSRICV